MAEFNWVNTPPEGTCLSCGTSASDRGFVHTHSEVKMMRNEFEISGYVDAIFCADCTLQMARLVGAATPAETEAFAMRELELMDENERLKDEVQAWQERFVTAANLTASDIELLKQVRQPDADPKAV